jgi:hypothetical protein
MNECRLVLGDCLDVMRGLESASIDACVADPPAGISFMGRSFDNPKTYQSDKAKARDRFLDFLTPRLAECLRVAKPGARLLCWAIPRTSHWTGLAIEDAGWIIEERLAHVFGQGFPKAKSKLKPAVEDWWLARKPGGKVPDLNIEACRVEMKAGDQKGEFGPHHRSLGEETTPNGIYGSGFQRAEHDQTTGRYPPNLLLSHHADCRPVGTTRVKGRNKSSGSIRGPSMSTETPHGYGYARPSEIVGYADADGLETVTAWQCVEGCPVRALDAQTAHLERAGNKGGTPMKSTGYSGGWAQDQTMPVSYGDSGGASRFYPQFTPADDLDFPGLYCPKASRADRGEGIDPNPEVRLRSDLTPEQREYVLSELVSAGVVL